MFELKTEDTNRLIKFLLDSLNKKQKMTKCIINGIERLTKKSSS